MKYTKKGLLHNYKDKFVNVYASYNNKSRCWEFEVRGVSDTVRENYEKPEDIIARHADECK